MLRSARALLSTLQVGGRVRQSFDRLLRQALFVVVAAAFIVAAAVLGLIAAYRELMTIYPPPKAALLMALVLLLLGVLVLAISPLIARKRKTTRRAPRRALSPIDGGMRKAVRQIGPLPLVLIAFAGGVLAGRR
jgi:ABC-type multidrug transport system fused ATPase/permease subunit